MIVIFLSKPIPVSLNPQEWEMNLNRIATWAATIVLGASGSIAVLSQPAGASSEGNHAGTNHNLVSIVNHSSNVEKKAKVHLHCSSSTGIMSLTVSGINTLDAQKNSFLDYFIANGVTPNIGWQLGTDAGNIVITQDPTSGLWAGNLRLQLPNVNSCSKGSAFTLTDQPYATGALKFTGVLS